MEEGAAGRKVGCFANVFRLRKRRGGGRRQEVKTEEAGVRIRNM